MGIIVAILFLCVVGYAIKNYNEGKKHIGVLVYFFFVSHGFYLVPDDVLSGFPINKLNDFGTIYLLYVLWHLATRKTVLKNYLNLHKECKLFFILFIYLTALFIWTVAARLELFGMSLAMYRNLFRFLSFILFIELSFNQLKWVFKWVFHITAFACVLFVIQPVIGIKTLTGGGVSDINYTGLARYRNIPYLTYFFLIYSTIRLRFNNPRRVLYVLLFAVSLVLTQHRGIMVGYVASIAIYLLMERKVGKMIQYAIIGGFLFLTVGSYVVARFEKTDTGSDFEALLKLDYMKVDFGEDNEGGTLTFRFMHLLERGDYLFRHPQYLLQGIGIRHEDSPLTEKNFHFYLCSRKMTEKGWHNDQIATGDLVWSLPLLQYGLIGIGLYIVEPYKGFNLLYSSKIYIK